jgi:hypothetical protein
LGALRRHRPETGVERHGRLSGVCGGARNRRQLAVDEDLGCFQERDSVHNKWPSCFYAPRFARRMAKSAARNRRLSDGRVLRLCRPWQWGMCGLTLWLWQALRWEEFCVKRLLPSPKGARWDQVAARARGLPTARAGQRVVDRSPLADLLGADAALCDSHALSVS